MWHLFVQLALRHLRFYVTFLNLLRMSPTLNVLRMSPTPTWIACLPHLHEARHLMRSLFKLGHHDGQIVTLWSNKQKNMRWSKFVKRTVFKQFILLMTLCGLLSNKPTVMHSTTRLFFFCFFHLFLTILFSFLQFFKVPCQNQFVRYPGSVCLRYDVGYPSDSNEKNNIICKNTYTITKVPIYLRFSAFCYHDNCQFFLSTTVKFFRHLKIYWAIELLE